MMSVLLTKPISLLLLLLLLLIFVLKPQRLKLFDSPIMADKLPKSHLLLILMLLTVLQSSLSQSPPSPAAEPAMSPAPAPAPDLCNGVFLSYVYTNGAELPPKNPVHQAYRFESILTVLNNGLEELKAWRAFVGFQHEDILVSATSAVLADGTGLPAAVGNGTVFAGFPQSDLKTAVQTAGDVKQMQVQVKLVGTQFGVKPPVVPMPVNISLANDGFLCSEPTLKGNKKKRNKVQV